MPWAAILLFIWQNRELLMKLLPMIIEIWKALKGSSTSPLLTAMKEVVATGDATPVTTLHERVTRFRDRS